MVQEKNIYSPSPEVIQAGSTNVGSLFRETARQNSDSIALIEGDRKLSYADLNTRVNQLAHAMLDQGVKQGDCVGLLARNCMAYVEAELASAKIGGITVNFNWRSSNEELAHCIELTTPKLIIATPDYTDVLEQLGSKANIVIGTDYEKMIAKHSDHEPNVAVDAEDGMVIIFTSGTTGLPKGALISHRALITRALIFATETNAPDKDTFIAWTPLFHMGSNDFTIATLLRGGQVVVIDGYQPEQMINTIETYPVHYLTVVPGMIDDFIGHLKRLDAKPKPIGLIGAMADLVPRPQLKEITTLLNAPYFNTFGSTETGNPPASGNLVAIGTAPEILSKKQNSFCEIRLIDADDNDVPEGEPGELAIRGPSLFSGYWANESANREAFRNGWFHMGDVFRRTPEGLLDFVDRVKYMIKSGGENIYPAEIEQYIMLDARIVDVAVVRKSDPRWGEVPVVFIVSNDPALNVDGVIDMCRGRIANFKLPKEVYFIEADDMPRTSTGKIQRHHLEARLEES
jgi:fatty-acyl-CoA synthase